MTIIEAITEAFRISGKPLTYKEVYETIIEHNLYQFGAKQPESVVHNKIRTHCIGLDFPSASPVKYFSIVSKEGKHLKYYSKDATSTSQSISIDLINNSDKLPEEKIHEAYLEHKQSIKQLLLQTILSSNPAFFERLVIDLLIKMGYGGDFPEAGIVTGGPGDGGIDGIIKEDRLGLDKIYIQAKRYSDNKIRKKELQQFVGAMENVQKGVFITTSSFDSKAKDYASKQQKSLALIDGDNLCELMIVHGVGVSNVKFYSTHKIDTDYFSVS